MNKFGQAEYSDYMARIFADKLDKIQKVFSANFNRQRTQHRRGKMVGFFIGLFVGAFIGITVMCLCTAAGQADKYENRT